MDKKITVLKSFLPPFLVTNSKLYSILSKGIHELTENECLNIFEHVKLGIELILDEKIEQIDREKKIKEAEQKLNSINNEIKSSIQK